MAQVNADLLKDVKDEHPQAPIPALVPDIDAQPLRISNGQITGG